MAKKPEAKKRIRMMTAVAGLTWSARQGEAIYVDESEADRYVASNQAVEVDDAAPIFVRDEGTPGDTSTIVPPGADPKKLSTLSDKDKKTDAEKKAEQKIKSDAAKADREAKEAADKARATGANKPADPKKDPKTTANKPGKGDEKAGSKGAAAASAPSTPIAPASILGDDASGEGSGPGDAPANPPVGD